MCIAFNNDWRKCLCASRWFYEIFKAHLGSCICKPVTLVVPELIELLWAPDCYSYQVCIRLRIIGATRSSPFLRVYHLNAKLPRFSELPTIMFNKPIVINSNAKKLLSLSHCSCNTEKKFVLVGQKYSESLIFYISDSVSTCRHLPTLKFFALSNIQAWFPGMFS